jgi:hypothetical protein
VTLARALLIFGVVAAVQACAPASPARGNPAPSAKPAARPATNQRLDSPQQCALIDPDARTALETLQRLDMVTTCREQTAGVLRLDLGPGFKRAPAEHHLNHLFNGYSQQVPADPKVLIELWKNGRKVGVYAIDGLVYDAERASPQ